MTISVSAAVSHGRNDGDDDEGKEGLNTGASVCDSYMCNPGSEHWRERSGPANSHRHPLPARPPNGRPGNPHSIHPSLSPTRPLSRSRRLFRRMKCPQQQHFNSLDIVGDLHQHCYSGQLPPSAQHYPFWSVSAVVEPPGIDITSQLRDADDIAAASISSILLRVSSHLHLRHPDPTFQCLERQRHFPPDQYNTQASDPTYLCIPFNDRKPADIPALSCMQTAETPTQAP